VYRRLFRVRAVACVDLLLLAFAIAYGTALGYELWQQALTWRTRHQGLDFPSYYLAARQVVRGADPYSGLRTEARLLLGMEDYFIDSAVGPPAFVFALTPLALLPYPAAWAVWQILSLAALVGSLLWILHALRPGLSTWERILLGSGVVLFPPLTFHLVYAHTELFLLLTLVAAWLCLRRGKQAPAGMLLGLAVSTRLYPALLLLFLAQRKFWKALATTIGTAAGVCVLAGAIMGPTSYLRYWAVLREVIPTLYARQGNFSLWGSVHKVAALWPPLSQRPWLRDGLAYLLSVGVVALTFLLGARHHEPPPQGPCVDLFSLDWGYALYIVACLLASPLSWANYQVLLYGPLILLWTTLKRRPSRPSLWAAGAGLAASLAPLLDLWPHHPRGITWFQTFGPTLTLVGIFLALAVLPRERAMLQDTARALPQGTA